MNQSEKRIYLIQELLKESDEYSRITIPKKTEEQKIVRFSTWSTLRIHPNDLCPCGSGKCYRKCCGRKKV